MTARAWFWVAAITVLLVGVAAWREGARRAIARDDAARYRVIHDTIVKQRDSIVTKLRVDTVTVRAAEAKRDTVKAAFESLAAAITASTADSLPSDLVIPAIQTCQATIQADSVVIADLHVTVDDALHFAALETRRGDLAEAHAKAIEKARPRFGFKAGAITVGALWVLSHFIPRS
jgi:hypothetical protein